MKRILWVLLILLTTCTTKTHTDNNSRLAGMYKLLIVERQDSAGIWRHEDEITTGDGYILYDGKGHMMVQIIPKNYKNFTWLKEEDAINAKKLKTAIDSLPVDELRTVLNKFASNYTYVANYTIQDSNALITHDRIASSIPAIWGTAVKRTFAFNDDTLTLKTPIGRKLVWVKQN